MDRQAITNRLESLCLEIRTASKLANAENALRLPDMLDDWANEIDSIRDVVRPESEPAGEILVL